VTRRTALFAAVVVAQLVVLYAPRAPSTGGVPGLDKLVHLTVFALVTATGLRSTAPRWVVLLVSVVQAPVSEVLQLTVLAHRDGELLDVVADLAGCAAGWLAVEGWARRRRGRMVA